MFTLGPQFSLLISNLRVVLELNYLFIYLLIICLHSIVRTKVTQNGHDESKKTQCEKQKIESQPEFGSKSTLREARLW